MSDREQQADRKARRDQHHVRALEAQKARARFALNSKAHYYGTTTNEEEQND